MLPLLRQAAGWVLLVAGIFGLFLPFLQGIVMIALGLTLLSRDAPWAKRLLRDVRDGTIRDRIRERWRKITGGRIAP